MNKQSSSFTATQTNEGFHVTLHDKAEELDITLNEINEFANKFAKETLKGKNLELSEKEEIIFSIWEMVLIPDSIKH